MKERRVYTAEFKREAVQLSEQAGVSVAQVAQELGISVYSIYKWRKQAKASGELAFPGNGKFALTAEQQENQRLKRELERMLVHLPVGSHTPQESDARFAKAQFDPPSPVLASPKHTAAHLHEPTPGTVYGRSDKADTAQED